MSGWHCRVGMVGHSRPTRLDSNGVLDIRLPTHITRLRVSYWPPDSSEDQATVRNLHVGRLEAVESVTGVQARLRNLGYYDGPLDGSESEILTKAIEDFEEACGNDPTGKLSDRLRDLLRSRHDA